MNLYKSTTYVEDLKTAINSTVNFDKLKQRSILVTGATGIIGSYIVDMMLYANKVYNSNITVYALGRSIQRLKERFGQIKTEKLNYVEHDVNSAIEFNFDVDYIIHAASNAYPAAFNNDPVGTIMTNIFGTYQLLEYGKTHNTRRLLYISSGEVYGEGDKSQDEFKEDYSGYVDPTQPRSCYPISKRNAENLCCSYTKQYGLDTVIVRPCHTYGPNSTSVDNRANVQFVNNVLSNEDIILKSAGNQERSYCYIADCTSAILTVLLNGKSCEAYNIANSNARVTVAGFAQIVANQTGHKVVFSNPNDLEVAERSPISKQVLCSKKIQEIGWNGSFSVERGIEHTLAVLKCN